MFLGQRCSLNRVTSIEICVRRLAMHACACEVPHSSREVIVWFPKHGHTIYPTTSTHFLAPAKSPGVDFKNVSSLVVFDYSALSLKRDVMHWAP